MTFPRAEKTATLKFCPYCGSDAVRSEKGLYFCDEPGCRHVFIVAYHRKRREAPRRKEPEDAR